MIEPCSHIDLESYVDGECAHDEAVLVGRHLRGCEACAAELRHLEQLNRALRAEMGGDVAPLALRRNISAMLSDAGMVAEHTSPSLFGMSRRRFAIAGFGAVTAAAAAAAVAPMVIDGGTGAERFAPTLISDFETFLFAEQTLDYVAGEASLVADWYGSRLDFGLPAIPASLAGNRLVGGRLCWLFNRRLASLSFDGSDGPLALYVMQADGLALPEGRNLPKLGQQVSAHQRDRFTNLIWRHGDLAMSLVGQATPGRMKEIAMTLTKAMNG